MSEKEDETGLAGKIFSVVFCAGIAFWLYDGGWAKMTGATSENLVVVETKTISSPGSKTKTPSKSSGTLAAVSGIAVFAASEDPDREPHLIFSNSLAEKSVAIANAETECHRLIAGASGLACRQLTFFENGCYVRYRFGAGSAPRIRGTLKEADAAALASCQEANNGDYKCVRDAAVCTDGSIRDVRSWKFRAVGLSPVRIGADNGGPSAGTFFADITSFGGAHATQLMKERCQKAYGSDCRAVNVLQGDQCASMAYSGGGSYAFVPGRAKGNVARQRCEKGGKYHCNVQTRCGPD